MANPDKVTDFRRWLHELWLQNSDEQRDYGQLPYTQEQYFRMYKYWLKREYRHQRNQRAG
jgi:hypothetical protein